MEKSKKSDTTKQLIARALEECLTEKRLEKVSVAEIMRKANMTRQMFYHYFQDINELVYWMHLRHTTLYTEQFHSRKNFTEAFGNALEEMYKHKEFYKNIITYNVFPSFADSFFEQMVSDASLHIGKSRINDDLRFSLLLYWHGTTDMLIEWIQNDMKLPPQVLVKRFYENLPPKLAKYYD